MIAVIHKECGGVAFYFKIRMYEGDVISAYNVLHVNGEPPHISEYIKCDFCGDKLYYPYENLIQIDLEKIIRGETNEKIF